jgi:DNA-binding Lrp family transcriptional regulator
MDPRFFNFRSGRWEIEWNKLAGLSPFPLPQRSEKGPEDFDYYDLLIIKELQKDSLQHLTGIAKKLKIHQKTLEYHYRTHVQKWKLIPSYRIRWSQDTVKRPTHSTAMLHLTFSNLSRTEFSELQAAVSKVPLLWMEYVLQNGTYIAMLYVPVTDLVNVSSYINDAVSNLASKLSMSLVKHSEATTFTAPYHMFQDGSWKFNLRQMERSLQKESAVQAQK